MKKEKQSVVTLIFLLGILLLAACSDNGTEPEIDPPVELPDITVTVDAFPKFTAATTNIRFFIDQISDAAETEHINLKFDHDGDGIFEEGEIDSVFWVYKINEMGRHYVSVLIEYDSTAFDTTQIQIDLTSPPIECYAIGGGWMAPDFSWSPDSENIVFTGTGHNPCIVNIEALTLSEPFEILGLTERHHGSMSPDNNYIVYDGAVDNGLAYIDLTTGIEEALTVGGSIQCISWSPDGTQLAVTTLHDTLFLIDFPGGEKTILNELANSVCWSSDGSKLLLAESSVGGIETIKSIDINTDEVSVLIENNYPGENAVFPGRLTWITNSSWIYSNLYKYFYNIETGQKIRLDIPHKLEAAAKELEDPVYDTALSPDGKYIAFTAIPPGHDRQILYHAEIPQEIYE